MPLARSRAVKAGTPVFSVGQPISMVAARSEEHTSELQSLRHLVCRLLLEKKKTTSTIRVVGLNGNYPRCGDRDLEEALSDTERGHPFNKQGGIQRDEPGLERILGNGFTG